MIKNLGIFGANPLEILCEPNIRTSLQELILHKL